MADLFATRSQQLDDDEISTTGDILRQISYCLPPGIVVRQEITCPHYEAASIGIRAKEISRWATECEWRACTYTHM